jgi:nucleoside-diphosphate-sugar epimerase
MKVLVTGATGFLGRHSLRILVDHGYEVHGVTSKQPPEKQSLNLTWHRADLMDPAAVERLAAEVTATHLLHFAWYAVPGKYWTSPENRRWVHASMELLRAFERHGGRRLVMAGSCAEYDWNHGVCSEFSTPLAPRTVYGECKHSLQGMVSTFSREAGMSSAWGRIFFLFGPHEHPDRLVSSVILSLMRGEIAKCSTGEQERDFLHVVRAASAFVTLLESDVEGPVNIASGRGIAVRDLVTKIAERVGRRDLIQFGERPAPLDEPPRLIADISRLRDEVRWQLPDSLDDDLVATIEWWRDVLTRRENERSGVHSQ